MAATSNSISPKLTINSALVGRPPAPPHLSSHANLATLSIHADSHLDSTRSGDIAPPIHVSTTYDKANSQGYIYSRASHPTRLRVDAVLGSLEGGHAVSYASGLAAVQALLQLVQPKSVLLIAGYHGVKQCFEQYVNNAQRHGTTINVYTSVDQIQQLKQLDLIWLESPHNPYCTIEDLDVYVALAKKLGAVTCVDATLSSPVGMLPLKHGIDYVMHSATKYLGGHSDVLVGALIAAPHREAEYEQLLYNRHLNTGPGSLESYLLLRSLRTLQVRVERQSQNTVQLINFFQTHRCITQIHHPMIPTHPSHTIANKYLRCAPATFSIVLHTQQQAEELPKHLKLVRNATSLGGYESLIEARYIYDPTIHPALLRVSVGLENVDDLIADYKQALDAVYSNTQQPGKSKL